MVLVALLASVAALIGTWIQMVDQLSRLSQTDPEGFAAFKTVDAWKDEHSQVRHLFKWLQHQRLVGELLEASPREAMDYRRARRAVLSWALLVLATFASATASLWALLDGRLG